MLGQNNQEGQASGKKFTGIRRVKFLGVNPSTEVITEWYGREPKKEPNYDLIEKNGNSYRPVTFYFKDTNTDKVVNMKFVVGAEVVGQPTNKDGNPINYKVLTTNGSVLYACAGGTTVPKPQFEDHTPLRMSEETVVSLVQAIIDWDGRLEKDFITGTQEDKLTAKHLFDGDYSGFNAAATDYAANTLFVTFVVTKDGDNYYQNLATDPNTIFSNHYASEPNDYVINRLKKKQEDQMAAGYSLFREGEYYSYKSQEFDLPAFSSAD